jgi:hypothetical protein
MFLYFYYPTGFHELVSLLFINIEKIILLSALLLYFSHFEFELILKQSACFLFIH